MIHCRPLQVKTIIYESTFINKKHALKARRTIVLLLKEGNAVIALVINGFQWMFLMDQQKLVIINQSYPNKAKILKK